MRDWRILSKFQQEMINQEIIKDIEPGLYKNENNGFEYREPDYTLAQVHAGNYCADCWLPEHNCLCNHI